MKKLIRITTIPGSLDTLLKGQLRYMNKYFNIVGVSSGGKRLKEVSQKEGVPTFSINMTRSITPFKDLLATYKLYSLFRKEKPFIVHTHTPKAGTLGMFAAKLARVPHRLHTVAGLPLLETTGSKRLLLNKIEKLTYKCATLILPNSFGLNKIILNQNFTNSSKLKVIGNGSSNGIDTKHYNSNKVSENDKTQLRNQLSIKPDDIVFVFVGRIVKDKGINELVTAFNTISKTNNNCKLIIVGPSESHLDPISSTTEKTIKTNKNIIAVGLKKDIRPYVAISHILTFPSYREGFPNVVLQASSMGLPCIVTDINGCNEIITDKVNGIIIPSKDETALKNAMLDLLNNPSKTSEMIKHTRPNIIKHYEQNFIWNELLKVYQSLK
jgi:glycosyltransferase involved in cell wall biosynthesis